MQCNSTPCWHTQALIKQGRDTEKSLKINYPSRKVASLWLLCPVTIHRVSLKWLKVHNPAQTKDRVRTAVVDRLLHLWIPYPVPTVTGSSPITQRLAQRKPHIAEDRLYLQRVFFTRRAKWKTLVLTFGTSVRRAALSPLSIALSFSDTSSRCPRSALKGKERKKSAQKHADNKLPSVKQMQQIVSRCKCFSELGGHFLSFHFLQCTTNNEQTDEICMHYTECSVIYLYAVLPGSINDILFL